MRPLARTPGCRVLLLAGLLMASTSAAQLTPQEERGKIIYLQGMSPSGGEITALMGDAGTEVPAAVIPCGGCHGRDGRGRPEGGIVPTNLTWQMLTKPYAVDHPGGRRHPPYDSRLVKRAITLGSDPAGNKLNQAMPRYRLSLQDIDDLVSYIEVLGSELDPGLTADSITLATLVPRESSLGRAVESVLRATFDRLNRAGGLYGRRIDLQVISLPRAIGERSNSLREALTTTEAFGLISPVISGFEHDFASLAAELEMPIIGPLTQQPHIEVPPNPFVFYLLPGLDDLSRALVGLAVAEGDGDGDGDGDGKATTVIVGPEPGLGDAATAIVEHAETLGWPPARVVEWSQPAASDLPSQLLSSPGPIFLLTGGEHQAEFFRAAAATGWYPRVFLPGSLLAASTFEAPAGFSDRISVAFPVHPAGQNSGKHLEYRSLAAEYALPAAHRSAQLTTLAAVEVLVEGLRRAGRDLSRSRLIHRLETLNEFDNGLTPWVTYGPNRRVGVLGAYVATVDLEHRTVAPGFEWVKVR